MTIALPLAPEPATDAIDPRVRVEQVVLCARSSFGTAMRVLPRQRREAIYAVYAFCRTVDDIADGDGTRAEKLALLSAWREEVDRLRKGVPQSTVGLALLQPMKTYDLDAGELDLMIEGMEMDANGPVVAPDLETLLAYTRRVAGSVGMLSMKIFGAWRGSVSDEFALALADALQLTNILRDVEEDAGIGRLYLPEDYLAEAGIETRDPAAVAADPRLVAVCEKLGALARERFETARSRMRAHSRLRLFPALMMMGVYEGYLRELQARSWRRERLPISFSSREKALRSLRYALLPLPPIGA